MPRSVIQMGRILFPSTFLVTQDSPANGAKYPYLPLTFYAMLPIALEAIFFLEKQVTQSTQKTGRPISEC